MLLKEMLSLTEVWQQTEPSTNHSCDKRVAQLCARQPAFVRDIVRPVGVVLLAAVRPCNCVARPDERYGAIAVRRALQGPRSFGFEES